MYIFTDEEKEFLFVNVLCNQAQHMQPDKITLASAKCFQKYFKIVNMSRNLVTVFQNKLSVVDFESLIGLDALWTFAVSTKNEKAR